MYSNGHKKTMEEGREPEVLMPKADNPRVKSLALKARWAFDENGKTLPKAKTFGLRDALFESIIDKFYEDPTLIAYGEDNRDWGGAYAVYRGLTEALPYHRFFNAPISESAIIGSSVGYAMCGGRVIVELMYADFIGCAGDEDIQSGREVAVDVSRYTEDADSNPCLGRLKVRSAAFSGLDGAHGAYSRS